MIRITIDEQLKQQLLASPEVAELCDESGKVIAHAEPLRPEITDPWSLFPELTDEEIERLANEPGERISHDEVMEHLRERMKRA